MNDARPVNVRADLWPTFAGRGAGSLLEIDAYQRDLAASGTADAARRRVSLRHGRGKRRRTGAQESS